MSIFLYRKKFGFGKSIISGAVTKYPGSAVLILYRKTFSAIVRLGRAELPTLSIKHPMFPAFFDPRVLRNREKTGPGDQTLAKSYDIGKLTPVLRKDGPMPRYVRRIDTSLVSS